ncbi:MAG: YceI family protein [Bacteroidota bacterium]|nr:YceI family protein [Bacteroidota bacterium]
MKKILFCMLTLLSVQLAGAQVRYFTKTGNISFQAGTALEDIDGTNKSATSVFDAGTGQIEFALLVKGFEFKSALMQEHFNENYMESDKFPKSVFKGKIMNIEKVNFKKTGEYPITVKGTLDIHGVSKEIETTGTIKVLNDETVTSSASFPVTLEDYKIAIPGLVKDKISKTAKIAVYCSYALLK